MTSREKLERLVFFAKKVGYEPDIQQYADDIEKELIALKELKPYISIKKEIIESYDMLHIEADSYMLGYGAAAKWLLEWKENEK